MARGHDGEAADLLTIVREREGEFHPGARTGSGSPNSAFLISSVMSTVMAPLGHPTEKSTEGRSWPPTHVRFVGQGACPLLWSRGAERGVE